MNNFNDLPREIQDHIFNLSMPTTVSVHLREEDYEVLSVSPPPSLLTVNKASSNTALGWDLQKYPIWIAGDWQDTYMSRQHDTTLELVITPSSSACLNITWTELHTILGEALTTAKRLHIVCAAPERLVRLFMRPEAELVTVGESCVEAGLFGSEVIASDRAVRENLRSDMLLTTSLNMVEASDARSQSNGRWKLAEEQIEKGVGLEKEVFTTKTHVRVEGEEVDLDAELNKSEETLAAKSEEEMWAEEKSRDQLSVANLELFTKQMEEWYGDWSIFYPDA